MPDPSPQLLASPTQAGQTHSLARLDGRLVALALWDRLPYWLKSVWQDSLEGVREAQLKRYLEHDASPLALALAKTSSLLPATMRLYAADRLSGSGFPRARMARLATHFDRLIDAPKGRLLRHLATADRVDPERDRLDLLAEVVALRNAQADVRAERALTRAFRAMFAVREPFLVWVLIAAMFAVFLALALAGSAATREAHQALRLEPGIARPWTLVTYAFLHLPGESKHIVLNMIALAGVGPVLELVMGRWRFLAFFLASAVFGALASLVAKAALGIPYATVGASAAIAGCAGLCFTLGLWFQRNHGRIPIRYVAGTLGGSVVLVSNFLIGAAAGGAGVDHVAHLGGLIFGVSSVYFLTPTLAARANSRFEPASRASGLFRTSGAASRK